jgi:hypothetical protein
LIVVAVVVMAVTASGAAVQSDSSSASSGSVSAVTGYQEVASDGGIFSFNAPFQGSMGGTHLNSPIVGIAADAATGGYWEVASDGGIFSFNAPFQGSMGGTHLNSPIVGIAPGSVAAVPAPPSPPRGSISSDSGSSSTATGTAAASNDGTAASATGVGALTVAQYASNPAGAASFNAAGEYFDVELSTGNSFAGASISACNLNGGNALEWWSPTASNGAGAWLPVSPTPTYTAGPPACLSIALSGSSSPALNQLTGTVFASAIQGLAQGAPTSATVAHGAGYSGQLTVTNANGTVTYAETTSGQSTQVVVGSTGAITAATSLAPGTYAVSGTDIDVSGDAGTWAFSLVVSTYTLAQGAPMANSVDSADSANFADQLTMTNAIGAVTYVEQPTSADLRVATAGGAVSTTGTLASGTYTVTGSEQDTAGDTGTFTYMLTVTP